ncbi:gluconokinase [Hoeflea marina]|uniref:Gluconokinase n=1 Tax=Hoeflea marina TaxID=274592 RepID=A0A317PH95_9HYPH|nr:gluconokinase [Hoeflea marina]
MDISPAESPGQPGAFILVMGVCGAGKSHVGRRLAARFGLRFVEADDYHSARNRAAMSAGQPLTDAERLPWLDAVAAAAIAARHETGRPVVIACSALRRVYRDRLRGQLAGMHVFHLAGSRALIAERLVSRRDHFVGPALLDSQLAILEPLEPDEEGDVFDIAASSDVIVDRALERLAALLAAADGLPGQGRPSAVRP